MRTPCKRSPRGEDSPRLQNEGMAAPAPQTELYKAPAMASGAAAHAAVLRLAGLQLLDRPLFQAHTS